MNIRRNSEEARSSRLRIVVAAGAAFAVAVAGLLALSHNTVHATHPPVAVPTVLAPPAAAEALLGAEALRGAWQPPASDTSVPSASAVFESHRAPVGDDLPPTF